MRLHLFDVERGFMSILYVQAQDTSLGSEGGHFIVKEKDGSIRKVPKETLESITVFGNVSISSQCCRECLSRGISINYFSTNGLYFGKLLSTMNIKGTRLVAQVHAMENDKFYLELSKKCVHAKISNQVVLLRRYARNSIKNIGVQISNIEISKRKINNCKTINELMGYEGNAAREYFQALSCLINKEFRFSGRNKRPPKDPFNSMLSLGYTIVMYEVYNAIESVGLSPYIGFMHATHNKHPTLASDMMEEWRAVLVDSVVMSLIQGNEIKLCHFETHDGEEGVFLTKEGMRIFVNKLEKKLSSRANYLCSNEPAAYFRRGVYLQSLALVRAIENNNVEEYVPLYIR